jgi:hypothetical protein
MPAAPLWPGQGFFRATAWVRLGVSNMGLLTFYSEGSVRTAYAAHCIQRGALRLALVSLKVCCCVLGTPRPSPSAFP